MPNAITDRPGFVFCFLAMLLSSYIAIGGRRALIILFFGQAAARSLPDRKVWWLRVLSGGSAMGLAVELLRYLVGW